jgi:hypothetical protein
MARQRYISSSGSDFGFALGAGVVVLLIIVLYVLVRLLASMIKTIVKYHRVSRALWYSLACLAGLSVLGALLAALSHAPGFLSLALLGLVVVCLTCVVVARVHANTFMVGSGVSIQQAVLKRNWWN